MNIDAPPPASAQAPLETKKRRRWPAILATGASLGILVLSVYVVSRTVAGLDLGALRAAIRATSAEQFFFAGVFTAGSFLALTLYDWLALRHLQERVRYRTIALASFSATSLSMTLGFPIVTGGTVRYWIYSRAGVKATRVAAIIMIVGLTYWMGVAGVVGVGLLLRPAEIADINQLKASVNMALGAGLIGALLAWVVLISMRRVSLRIRGLLIQAPRPRLAVAQILVAMTDLSCAAGALWALLPSGHGMDFFTFAPAFVTALVLGVASNVPGGIGPFEATMLNAIWELPAETVLASLLLFRIVYFLAPFVLGLALLGAHEIWTRWTSLRAAMAEEASRD